MKKTTGKRGDCGHTSKSADARIACRSRQETATVKVAPRASLRHVLAPQRRRKNLDADTKKSSLLKIYLGGPMFSAADIEYNLKLAKKIRKEGFEVYCPNENMSINDKNRTDITAERIYLADMLEIERSNVFLCQVFEDAGTMWESGYMDCLSRKVDPDKYYGCIGLATDIRLQTPPNPKQPGVDNQTFYLNQFAVGGLKLSLGIYSNETDLIERLCRLRDEHHAK